jgi:hypothetical protein
MMKLRTLFMTAVLSLAMSVAVFAAPIGNGGVDNGQAQPDSNTGVAASSTNLEGGADDYSFYKMSSAASMFVNGAMSPDGQYSLSEWQGVNNGGISGALLGFSDANKTKGVVSFFTGLTSAATASVSYDALIQADEDPDINMGFSGYALYGAALSDLGLDKMIADGSIANIVRSIAGALALFVYVLAKLPFVVFQVSINILQALNPFKWLMYAGHALDADTLSMMGPLATPLEGIARFVSHIYDMFYGLGVYVVIPLGLIFIIASLYIRKILLFQRGLPRGFKRFVIRACFMLFGVALLGSVYTVSLDAMSTGVDFSLSDVAVKRYFVDFERWFSWNALALPSDASDLLYNVSSGHVSGTFGVSLADNVLKINNSVSPSIIHAGTEQDNAAFSLLLRYMRNSTFEATDFESEIKTKLRDNLGSDSALFKKQFTNAGKPKNFEKIDPTNTSPTDDSSIFFATAGGITATKVSGITNGKVYKLQTTGSPGAFKSFGTGSRTSTMSPITAYNYLSTRFDSRMMTMYSQEKASSNFVKFKHASVNLAGTGFIGFLNYLCYITLMLAVGLVGIHYALGMMFQALKQSFAFLTSLPFAMLGFIGMIAKTIGAVVLTVFEILVTWLLFSFIVQVLSFLPEIVTAPIQRAFTEKYDSAGILSDLISNGGATFFMQIAGGLIYLAVMFYFIKWAIKLRGTVLMSFETITMRAIDKFLAVEGSGASDHMREGEAGDRSGANRAARNVMAAGAALAGGIGSGIVLAAGAKALQGNKSNTNAPTKSVASGSGDDNTPNTPDDNNGTNNPNDPNSPNGTGGTDQTGNTGNGNNTGNGTGNATGNGRTGRANRSGQNSGQTGQNGQNSSGTQSETSERSQAESEQIDLGNEVLQQNSLADTIKIDDATMSEAKSGNRVKPNRSTGNGSTVNSGSGTDTSGEAGSSVSVASANAEISAGNVTVTTSDGQTANGQPSASTSRVSGGTGKAVRPAQNTVSTVQSTEGVTGSAPQGDTDSGNATQFTGQSAVRSHVRAESNEASAQVEVSTNESSRGGSTTQSATRSVRQATDTVNMQSLSDGNASVPSESTGNGGYAPQGSSTSSRNVRRVQAERSQDVTEDTEVEMTNQSRVNQNISGRTLNGQSVSQASGNVSFGDASVSAPVSGGDVNVPSAGHAPSRLQRNTVKRSQTAEIEQSTVIETTNDTRVRNNTSEVVWGQASVTGGTVQSQGHSVSGTANLSGEHVNLADEKNRKSDVNDKGDSGNTLRKRPLRPKK